MSELIYHLAFEDDWDAALSTGQYRISTRGRTLSEVGFIHFCRSEQQLRHVADEFYADATDPLCLLTVDTDLVSDPVVDEPAPGVDEFFPHLYGPLPVSAVVAVTPLERDDAGRLGPLAVTG